jgi:hypothetical protein
MAKPMLKQLSASGKAMFDRPLLASFAVSGIRSYDIPKISGTLWPLSLKCGATVAMRTTLDGLFDG